MKNPHPFYNIYINILHWLVNNELSSKSYRSWGKLLLWSINSSQRNLCNSHDVRAHRSTAIWAHSHLKKKHCSRSSMMLKIAIFLLPFRFSLVVVLETSDYRSTSDFSFNLKIIRAIINNTHSADTRTSHIDRGREKLLGIIIIICTLLVLVRTGFKSRESRCFLPNSCNVYLRSTSQDCGSFKRCLYFTLVQILFFIQILNRLFAEAESLFVTFMQVNYL